MIENITKQIKIIQSILIITITLQFCKMVHSLPRDLPDAVHYFTPDDNHVDAISTEKTQEARLNIPPGAIENFAGNLLHNGLYPIKLDVGGLFLGAVIGLGALIFIPKLLHIITTDLSPNPPPFAPPYGRSDDIGDGISNIMSKFDQVLMENNINYTECVSKAICTFVRSSNYNNDSERKSVNYVENMISLMKFVINEPAYERAIENGRNRENCGEHYPSCQISSKNVLSGIKNLVKN